MDEGGTGGEEQDMQMRKGTSGVGRGEVRGGEARERDKARMERLTWACPWRLRM